MPTPSVSIAVAVSPANVTLGPGQQQKFTAIVTGTANTAVSWSVSPTFGSIAQDGTYTAPSSAVNAPAVTVTAVSQADTTKSGSTSANFYDPSSDSPGTAPGSGYPIQATFLNFYRSLTPDLWALEFQYMKQVNISTIVIDSVGQVDTSSTGNYALAADGLIYPSQYIAPAARPRNDLLELLLSLADAQGMSVYVGSLETTTDWTSLVQSQFAAVEQWNHNTASEILLRYGRHASLKGWYFTQEIWMNWVKYNGGANYDASQYYGTTYLANWVADMKGLDVKKSAATALVVKETIACNTNPNDPMPGMTASELRGWMTSFLSLAKLDVIMPEDGQGAQCGAPSLTDLPSYFSAMAAAAQSAGTNTALWSTVETFSYASGVGAPRYPPADANRIEQQISAVRPYVSGYISWIFGDDISPQATYYPVEASELSRRYKYVLNQATPNYDYIPLQSYQFSSAPSAQYPDSSTAPKLSDRTGGGYSDAYTLATWVGFASNTYTTLQITGDLGSVKQVAQVRALAMSWAPSGILHPSQVEVDYSQDGLNWAAFGSTNAFPPDAPSYSVMWGEVDGSASARYVRWTFTYWQWLMLAELEVIGPQ